MILALMVSTGAPWESRALGVLSADPGVTLLKRCVDLDDLLAAASLGQAEVAVVGAEVGGLDPTALADLGAHGVRVVLVAPDPGAVAGTAVRSGVAQVVGADALDDLGRVVRATGAAEAQPAVTTLPPLPGTGAAASAIPGSLAATQPGTGRPRGRVVAVWGPAGAPGRTTVAAALAAELARRELTTVLVDADPYGGAAAQQLGVLDEVSGLLAAARLAATGTLEERVATVQRRLSDRLRIVTGLPRADRWVEIRAGVLTQLADATRTGAQVVLDTGFSLEHDPVGDLGARPERNQMTLEALDIADEIVVVGAADPVGLARLARGLTELHELLGAPRVRLVVNRMRPTLGWRESDVAAMLGGFGPAASTHFLPDDQPAVDRALVAGRTLVEVGDSSLTRGVTALVDAMAGASAGAAATGRFRR